jgi:hypothetical protein
LADVAENLKELARVLYAHVEAKLSDHLGEDWLRKAVIRSSGGHVRARASTDALDLYALIKILKAFRSEVFQHTLDSRGFNYVSMILDVRNRLAHMPAKGPELTQREERHAIDTIALLIDIISPGTPDFSPTPAMRAPVVVEELEDQCCTDKHPFDQFAVVEKWWPGKIKCLIVGENPGAADSLYFYDRHQAEGSDPVHVRKYLLAMLKTHGLIKDPSLGAFREAGFAFDHAIRCPLPQEVVEKERQAAQRFRSERAHRAEHLRDVLGRVPKTWAMGLIARDAITFVLGMEQVKRKLHPPYSMSADGRTRLFISEYVTWHSPKHHADIGTAFKRFLNEQ